MGVNKVDTSNGETLIDLTGDTVTPETLAEGATAHDMAGNPIVGTMATGDFIIHIKCTPQYEYFDSSASGGTSNPDAPIEPTPYIHGDYWVYSPHQLTPEEYIAAYNAKRPLKVKAEITRDDGSSVTVIAPCTGESSSDPWGLVFTVNHNQEEFKFTLHQGKYGEQSDGTPIYMVYVRVHDIVDILTKVNMVTEITPDATDDTFPSALAVVSYVDEAIQDVGSGSGEGNTFTFDFVYADGVVSLPANVTYSLLLDKFKAGVHIVGCLDVPITAGANFGTYFLPMCYGTELAGFLVFTAWKNNVRVNVQVSLDGSLTYAFTQISTSITANSTHFEFPSAKAVHDFVQANAGGGGGESASNTFIVKLLTSLSASGLSLSLPSDVTYSDVNNAVDNGLHVIAIADIPPVAGDIAGTYAIPFAYKETSGNLIFSVMVRDMNLCVTVTPSGAISFTYFFAEQSGRKIDSIHAGVTHTNYPSAKAVYDFVQGEKQVETITCDFDLFTMTISNLSHTYQQVVDALNANKYCVFKSTIINGFTFSTVSALNTIDNQIQLQLLAYGNIDGSGLRLYFFNIVIQQDNSITVHPKLVSTVG
jgi:hypothetical protein